MGFRGRRVVNRQYNIICDIMSIAVAPSNLKISKGDA